MLHIKRLVLTGLFALALLAPVTVSKNANNHVEVSPSAIIADGDETPPPPPGGPGQGGYTWNG